MEKAIEVISDYSEEKMELTFEAANLPPILSTAANIQRVIPKGENKSMITFDRNIGLKGVFKILSRRFQKMMDGVQRDLKMHAETSV